MKPTFRRDLRRGDRPGFQEADGSLNTQLQYKLVWRQTDSAAEETGKVERAEVRLAREAMVLLDDNFDATEIYEADRESVIDALTVPGSKARNERGALGVSKFRHIGCEVWRR